MRILAVEKDAGVRALYTSYLSKKLHSVQTIETLPEHLGLFDAHNYDVVIVDKEATKHVLTNIRWDHVVVAANNPKAQRDGSWAITKPFHMEELEEILEIVQEGKPPVYTKLM